LATLRARGPYPLLAISGEQGSAKTVLSKMLKALIDPSAAPVRALPREERELMIAANNGYLLAFDNLSGLPAWLSDALCRLASGGSFAVRPLYTDDDEVDRLAAFTYGNMAPCHCAKHSPAAQHRTCFQQAHPHVCDADGSTQTLPDRRGAEGHGAARANGMLATWTAAIWAASIRKIGKTTLRLWMRPCTRVIIVVARENIA
jgi:hypothetical protein